MARRRSSKKRDYIPDPKYGDIIVSRFVNYIMRKGKKSTAEQIVYESFGIIEEKTGQKGVDVFKKALEAVKPAEAEKRLAAMNPEQRAMYEKA